MTIAEKLAKIAENAPKVYQAGYEKGKAEGGGEDNYLLYSLTARFGNLNLFGKADVVIDIPHLSNAGQMFRPDTSVFGQNALNRTVQHLTVNSKSKNITSTYQMFYFAEPWDGDTALRHITLNLDMSKSTQVNQMFAGMGKLETVDGTPLDFSSAVDATIRIGSASPNLAYIRFVPNTIKCNLNASDSRAYTKESIQSIMGGLNDSVTGKTVSFTLVAVNKAFETSEGANDGSTSAEWQSLVGTKPNWTISLA